MHAHGAPHGLDHLISVAQAQQALGVGRTTVYALIKEKRLAIVKIGRRTLISARQIQLFIDSLSVPHGGDDGRGA